MAWGSQVRSGLLSPWSELPASRRVCPGGHAAKGQAPAPSDRAPPREGLAKRSFAHQCVPKEDLGNEGVGPGERGVTGPAPGRSQPTSRSC